jgi:dual specificity protein kinase YAK1
MDHQWAQHHHHQQQQYGSPSGLDSGPDAVNGAGGLSRRNTTTLATQSPHLQQQHHQQAAASPISGGHMLPSSPHMRDGSGDVAMQDSHDARAGIKYPSRPIRQTSQMPSPQLSQQHHQQQQQQQPPLPHHLSNRVPTLQSQESSSAAATRYSPLGALSPTSPYASKPIGQPPPGPAPYRAADGAMQSQQQPQSPRQGDYAPHSPYFRQQAGQLPQISPYGGLSHHDSYSPGQQDSAFAGPRSPGRNLVQPMPLVPTPRGPVPEFKKVRGVQDLRPKVNAQPAFRRANPEGGFISVWAAFPPSRVLSRSRHTRAPARTQPSSPLVADSEPCSIGSRYKL